MVKHLGLVLVFRSNVERAVAQALVDKLIREFIVDERLSTQIHSFEPAKEGAPVWYIP